MKKLVKTLVFILSATLGQCAWALSPPNITNNIPWTDAGGIGFGAAFSGVSDIEAAFNNGRREEESQLGLVVDTLGSLDLPSQAVWDTMTDDAKALLILNEERQDRAGMQADVIGLPLAGIESHMDNISKNYGDLLHDTDQTGHAADGLGPFTRIDNDTDIGDTAGCHEFLARGENLAYFATTGNNIPLPLERAIYGFIYDDSGSNWGHREAALLQSETLDQAGSHWGFLNNNENNASEGFLGVYVRSSADYKPFSDFSSNYASVVVMNIFDPVSSPTSCSYNVTLDHTETLSAKAKVPTFNVPNNRWTQIGLNAEAGTGSTVADIVGDDISGTYDTDWVVFSYQTSTNTYQKLTLADIMLPGIGYWLIQVTGSAVTIDMPNSSSGVYVTHTSACGSPEGCFEIPLHVNASGGTQWQMIGYPFRDSRNMDGVKIVTNSGVCASGCTLSEADAEGLVADRLWHYSGTAYQLLTDGGSEMFDPWDGAWIAILAGADGESPKLLIPATN